MSLDEFFGDAAQSRQLFDALAHELAKLGKTSLRITKSQIAFRRKRNVAIAWMPRKYLKQPAAPLVLTVSFPERDGSPRWKDVTQVAPHRFTHHLELFRADDIDADVKDWLRRAWQDDAPALKE